MLEEKAAKYEHVDHPAHYGGKDSPYEAIKVISAWLGSRGVFDFDLGNALKYICRAGAKPSASGVSGLKQDLQKAVWYLNHAIEVVSYQMCLVRKDDGFDSDSSAAKEQAEAPEEEDLPGGIIPGATAYAMVVQLVKILATRPNDFLSLLSAIAGDCRFKKGDTEMASLLDVFRATCFLYVAEATPDGGAEEEGVSGEAGRVEEGGSNGKGSDGLAQDTDKLPQAGESGWKV